MLSIASIAAWILVTAAARVVRGRLFATFAGVMLGIHTAIAVGVAPLLGRALPLFLWLHATVYVHFLLLARPPRVGMRPLAFRALVSVPGSFAFAGTFLAMPWAIASAFGVALPWIAAPYALAGLGLLQSLFAREEEVDLVLGGPPVDGVRFHPHGMSAPPERRDARPLRVVQITDPHLGPFMSIARLRRICARAVAREPDLIVLTGDFLTMGSH